MTLNYYSTSPQIHLEETDSIPALFFARARRTPHAVVMMRPKPFEQGWEEITASTLATQIIDLARGFIGMGLNPGDCIAIMAGTSYDWVLVDYAGQSAGLTVVPIYETDAASQVDWILEDTGSRLVITDTATQQRLVESTGRQVDLGVFAMEDGALDQIRLLGAGVSKQEVKDRLANVNLDSLLSVVYTSGTTGKPKGVELTQRNFCYMALMIGDALPEVIDNKRTRLLLLLPLAHVFARFASFTVLSGRGMLACIPNVKNLLSDLQTFKPTAMTVVPRVLEKIYTAAQVKAGKGLKHTVFSWAVNQAIRYSQALDDPKGPGWRLKRQHAWADRLVFSKIHEILGNDCKYVISGGAPLGARLGHFYRGISLNVIEGWGLTETAGPVTGNVPEVRIPSVGRPLPGVEIKTDEAGEIFVRSDLVMRGYRHNPTATAEALDKEGWFATGDLGEIDNDGFLTITGRKKELIVTASGKNVSPAPLEDAFRGHPLVSNVVVIGDKRPFVSALVTLDREMLPTWLANHKLPPMDAAAAAVHPAVQESLMRGAARASEAVSRAESIRKVRVIVSDFTVDNGLLTPSLKVRRDLVLKKYAREIDSIYEK
ncbi:MAG: long-chain fatty acid--CoA ligase [Mobiluncus porci]|uniref:AMP-dependent synthetase/ligase n=1 Tax=Mobiluncus TaxID=2050 RepID=UPI0023F4204A|nr:MULTISPECIES: long-chain fatty acid--CoA ligase [Mobiluncus]MCI6584344.1 long-chain fatty acid--CoA ligase [Mobiluncus sp.]MDD7541762.1 long-chain fatty acid--CoA ligase [Mobiluncus porci]MDY5748610.1 long-chain fatty acid--CoA ligase [Mobiluncus porci]